VFKGSGFGLFLHMVVCLWAYYWGCAKVYGRGTLYMKWGQQNQRFGTMRLRGEKDEKEERRKCDKIENMINCEMSENGNINI